MSWAHPFTVLGLVGLLGVAGCGGGVEARPVEAGHVESSLLTRAGSLRGENGTLLAFVADLDDQWDVFVWDPFGDAEPRRLTGTPLDEAAPRLAPDRSRVVYTDSAGDVWVVPLEGGEPARVTTPAEQDLYLQPAFGPDGRSLLFARREVRHRDDTDLALVDLEPAPEGAEPLVLGPDWLPLESETPTRAIGMLSSQFYPAWGPEGRRMAFTQLQSRWAGRVIAEIWEARVDHSDCRQLTLTDALCLEPTWSPTGAEVAFSADTEGQFDLYVVEVETRELRRLTEDPAADTEPCYGPEGARLVFTSRRGGSAALWMLETESGIVQPLRPFDRDVPCTGASWR